MDKAEKVGRADICPSQLLDALDSCQQESQTSCHHHVTKSILTSHERRDYLSCITVSDV